MMAHRAGDVQRPLGVMPFVCRPEQRISMLRTMPPVVEKIIGDREQCQLRQRAPPGVAPGDGDEGSERGGG